MIEFDAATVDVDTPAGRHRILHPTSLRLTEQRVAIIGGNGSGKSTLARLVNGLISPSVGTVTVDGLDVGRHGSLVRRKVGFVFTDPAAQIVMPTVIEDIAISLRSTHRKRAERAAAALRVAVEFGLDGLAEHSVYNLSGGQRQLLALAGVLATDPQILIADEPTTLLDLRNSMLIADRLLALAPQLLLVTHDLELALRCDRAICLDAGRVIADGTPGEVVTTYRAMAAT